MPGFLFFRGRKRCSYLLASRVRAIPARCLRLDGDSTDPKPQLNYASARSFGMAWIGVAWRYGAARTR
jgi:hypothetical protein